MCRQVGWVSRTPRTLEQVLGSAAFERLVHLSTVHADGWGAAWNDAAGRRQVMHSPLPAHADDEFLNFARNVASSAAFIHFRLGTPGYGGGQRNTHPFVDGAWAFGHNGAISPPERVDRLLPNHGTRRPLSQTDSERYFLALCEELDHNGGAVPDAVDHVIMQMEHGGLATSSLNAILLGAEALHIVSCHDPAWQATTIPVWPADDLATGAVPPYFPMTFRKTDQLVVAVSSGIIVHDHTDWISIPNDSVLTTTLDTRKTTLDPLARSPAARTSPALRTDT